MENIEWKLQWDKLSNKILSLRRVSIAKKLLAYKVFLRPLLISSWYEGCDEQIKELELNVLRKIFDVHNSEEVYRLYTDLDITTYLKVQELRLKRLNLSTKPLRNVLHKVAKKNDNVSYYTRSSDVRRVRRKRRTRRPRPDSDDSDSIMSIFTSETEENKDKNTSKKSKGDTDKSDPPENSKNQLRRSLRIADKKNKN